jgi:hypothetical protein
VSADRETKEKDLAHWHAQGRNFLETLCTLSISIFRPDCQTESQGLNRRHARQRDHTMPSNFQNHPYGAYLCRDSIVYFNRRYEPIVRLRQPAFPASGNQVVSACDPAERIVHSGKHFFYSDANPPRRDSQTRKRLQTLLDTIPALAAEVQRRGSRRRMVAA